MGWSLMYGLQVAEEVHQVLTRIGCAGPRPNKIGGSTGSKYYRWKPIFRALHRLWLLLVLGNIAYQLACNDHAHAVIIGDKAELLYRINH